MKISSFIIKDFVTTLFLVCCWGATPMNAMTENLSASKGSTPFTLFKSLLEGQGDDVSTLTLLSPIPTSTVEAIVPELKKTLKVKEEIVIADEPTVGSIITTILRSKYGKKSNEKNDFLSIQYSPLTSDFTDYLERYPLSKYAPEAQVRKTCLEDNALWLKALESGKRKDYEEFADSCGNHMVCEYDGCETLSKTNHQRAQAVKAWYDLTDHSDGKNHAIYKDYATYLEEYGHLSVFSHEANDSMVLNKDKYDWAIALGDDTITAYQRYLEDHSEGRYSWYAENAVAQMELWDIASSSGDYNAYCTYFTSFPDGRYAKEAGEAMMKHEDADWTSTKKKNTLVAYEQFVEKYPNGYYASEAQNKISEIRLAPYLKEAPSISSISQVGFYSHPGYSLICIGNIDKNNKMTISLKGPTGFSKTIVPGKFEWVRVKNGTYKLLVQASKTENWWGNATFENRMYVGAWSTYTNTLFGTQKQTNKDEETLSRIKEAVKEKVAEEEINTRKYIMGID